MHQEDASGRSLPLHGQHAREAIAYQSAANFGEALETMRLVETIAAGAARACRD
jgi:hypothetical protein